MKRLVAMMAVAIAMITCSVNLSAQTPDNQRMTREQLAEAQARHIAHELALDDATTQKYVTTFCQYQQEVWALGPRVKRPRGTSMTEEESGQMIQDRFAHSQKILDLREKYYKEYSKFLTQKQIERAYELEKKTMQRLGRHHRQKGTALKHHRRHSRTR